MFAKYLSKILYTGTVKMFCDVNLIFNCQMITNEALLYQIIMATPKGQCRVENIQPV